MKNTLAGVTQKPVCGVKFKKGGDRGIHFLQIRSDS